MADARVSCSCEVVEGFCGQSMSLKGFPKNLG
jgi:hypothetical protein